MEPLKIHLRNQQYKDMILNAPYDIYIKSISLATAPYSQVHKEVC